MSLDTIKWKFLTKKESQYVKDTLGIIDDIIFTEYYTINFYIEDKTITIIDETENRGDTVVKSIKDIDLYRNLCKYFNV